MLPQLRSQPGFVADEAIQIGASGNVTIGGWRTATNAAAATAQLAAHEAAG